MCFYVKDTSRSTETVSVCVCVYVRDTSRSTETVCVCVFLCERHE